VLADALPPPSPSDSTMRILISSDNHLVGGGRVGGRPRRWKRVESVPTPVPPPQGCWEKDDARRNDSFDTFDEVFELATQNKARWGRGEKEGRRAAPRRRRRPPCFFPPSLPLQADFVLLGGDLFHDNRPSRSTVVRALSTLYRHCLRGGGGGAGGGGGDDARRLRPTTRLALDAPTTGRPPADGIVGGAANFGDPSVAVTLPVFTIHGNHDDPGGADNLSAVDMLAAARAVNYFGKVPLEGSEQGRLAINPVIVSRRAADGAPSPAPRVALYGLGAHREDRVARVFRAAGAVTWEAPPADTYNIFVIHQNREARGRASAGGHTLVDPRCLPPWLDLVVWGHEHECLGEVSVGGVPFAVLQPGSTVATALSEGEAAPKHAYLLEIDAGAMAAASRRRAGVAADSASPSPPSPRAAHHAFRVTSLPLDTARRFAYRTLSLKSKLAPGVDGEGAAVEAVLAAEVDAALADAAARAPAGLGGRAPPEPPLVRLRVDYTGFTTLRR